MSEYDVLGSKGKKINVERFIGDKVVLDTGTLISYNSESITIAIDDVKIRFDFHQDNKISGESNIGVSRDPLRADTLVFKLTNMVNSVPEGSPEEFHIANIDEKKIFISFFSITVSEEVGVRMLHYTLTKEV